MFRLSCMRAIPLFPKVDLFLSNTYLHQDVDEFDKEQFDKSKTLAYRDGNEENKSNANRQPL